jgi:hypothetical protein
MMAMSADERRRSDLDLLGFNSPLDRPLLATRFPNRFAMQKQNKKYTLRELADTVEATLSPDKASAPFFKLARFGELKSAKDSLRHDANVISIDGIEGDYDQEQIPITQGAEMLKAAGIAALLFESPSSSPVRPRWRVACPCSTSLDPSERACLVARLNGVLGGTLDNVSHTLSQSFYYGGIEGKPKPETILVDGRFIDDAHNLDTGAIGRRGNNANEETATDDSRSGAAFRKAESLQLNGGTIEEFEEWAVDNPWKDYECNPKRAIDRTWERAGIEASKIALSKLRDPLEFEDLGPDSEKPKSRKSTLNDLDLANLESANGSAEFVEGIFAADSFSCVYGAPSAGKTFFLLDLALHVACNRPWNGRGVEQSGVVYVALEGAGGFAKRLKAWCKHHRVTDLADLPFHAMVGSFDMRNDKSTTGDIVETVKAKSAIWGKPVRLIVIDTLARAMAGGDENSAKDMGAIIAIADSIRLATGANVCLVHHSGKDDSRGARGSNALLGAVDTEIKVDRDGLTRTAIVKKQKDGQEGDCFEFQLETIDFGTLNKWGKPVTSCVPVAARAASFDPVDRLSERQRTAYQILEKGLQEGGRSSVQKSGWRTLLSSALWMESGRYGRKADDESPSDETFKRKFREVVKDLETQGFITVEGDNVSLAH